MKSTRWGAVLAGAVLSLALAGPALASDQLPASGQLSAYGAAIPSPAPEPSTDEDLYLGDDDEGGPDRQIPTPPESVTTQDDTALECVDVNTASAEELRMLRHVDADRAQQILALRPFSDIDDLDRVNGLRAGGPRLAELVAGGGRWLPLCPFAASGPAGGSGDDEEADPAAVPAPGTGGEQLPLTGAALPLLVGTGVALAGAGGATVVLARRRQRRFTA